MSTTRIYVDPIRMRAGDPAIAVDRGKPEVEFTYKAELTGPSQVVSDAAGMPPSVGGGPRRPIHIWVETESAVES